MLKNQPLLKVEDLSIHFSTYRGTLKAVRNIGFEVQSGEILGLVGESGCGKSITARSILRLLKTPPASIPTGSIWFKGENLLELPEERIRDVRGRQISMIFQEPMTSLNPVFRVGDQVAEAVTAHIKLSEKETRDIVLGAFRDVGISDPERRYRQYPHQLSGGLRQRVMISMALVAKSSLLIADEPTTALDVTIQAQILDLIKDSVRDRGISVLFITHDLGVISQTADRVLVMYAGTIVEEGPVKEILAEPAHPYTRGLIACIPKVNALHSSDARLTALEGMVPELYETPTGCPFAERCDSVREICRTKKPTFSKININHQTACFLYGTGD